MYKHSPSRNQRSKGFKMKQVLQICVLVAVCFWLFYQVKHSHDKKKAFEENDANTSLEANSHSLVFGGRKGIQDPLQKRPLITKKKYEEETEHENGAEEVDNKHKEEVHEKEEDSEKSEMEIEHDVDILDEERDREEVNENEDKENKNKDEDEDEETQDKDVSHVEDHDHEAREEQYKGDDASSAVTHESESVFVKIEKGNPENTLEKMGNVLENGKVANSTEDVFVDKNTTGVKEKGEIAQDVISLNVTTKEEEKSVNVLSKQGETPVSNSTTTNSNNQEETGKDMAKESIENTPRMNKQDAGEGKTSTNSSLNNTRLDPNTVNSSTTSNTVVSEQEKTKENTEENRNENLKSEKEKLESKTEEVGVDHLDPIDDSDSTISLEKNVRTNLDRTRRNDEQVAAE